MGLFDFLKKKPGTPETTPSPAATPSTGPASAETPAATPAPATGPRYKGSNYTLPVEEPADLGIPPMPAYEPEPAQPVFPPFQPTNILEELLIRAAHEPELRGAFYQALVNEDILAVTLAKEGEPGGEIEVTPGMEIQLQVLNDGKIPLFTSVERIFEGGVSPEGISYIRVRGHDLLQMVQATDCVLNPFSPAGKLLTSPEITDLLAGNLFGPMDGNAPENVPVQLSTPAETPTELIAALNEFCASNPLIEQAYLAELRVANAEVAPRLLLAFKKDDMDPSFLESLGPVIQGRIEGYQFVDMMLLDPTSEEPLNQYFENQEPFYQRA